MILANEFKKCRERKKITIDKLLSNLSIKYFKPITRYRYMKLENGDSLPNSLELQILCNEYDIKPPMETYGDLIKKYRQKAAIKQKEIAAEIGCAPCLISSYETGAIIPSIEKINQISNVIGIDPSLLIDLH